jgi:hypothetical protein
MNKPILILLITFSLYGLVLLNTHNPLPLAQLTVISIAENEPLMKPQVFGSDSHCQRTKNLMLDLLRGLDKTDVIDVVCTPYELPTEFLQ